MPRTRSPRRWRGALAAALAVGLTATACSGAGGGSSGDGTAITVLMVGNPQMEDLARITADKFTADTGITVRFTILPENELRDRVTQDVATQGGQYDVATIGAYEAPIWAQNDWLHELSSYADADSAYDKGDLLGPAVASLSGADGKLYAAPFYGESSFLMYNKELFDAAGLTMPERPTWQQVAQFAAELDDKDAGVAGICLRGLPGWGELFAPLTTVVNTFGGTWFEQDWTPKVNAPEFTEATKFYVDLLRAHGQPGAPQSGFTECLNTFGQGKAAMWYDATSAAGTLEDPNSSTVAGKVGYAYAPVSKTDSSGWLWVWALAMPKTTKNADAAWKFISWATGKEYEKLVGSSLGWSRVPAGKRQSTYEIPEYRESAAAFADITLKSIQEADPVNPGVQPRPALGVQFVGIPEFADLGTKVSQEVSAAIAGQSTVEEALADGQRLAEEAASKHR
ncbi:ABC transporter substrate-binding protein [Micromonospora endophytica]|uniref:Sugar ABC transporter substrate-binding protein n=1 Tax=Micromonospora endophytica TaxID=515350 RepID=A0A2W2CQX5_9ACTN|nr:sugar ABC transporter substrate-binding protein [Micromonospora endophytica]PZG01023.1 sugar ABC transporter substrate-binding protein [Micromonospora endophytica]RIW47935.1 sugar ABC transporter substrate-binding protein [Micromonospora endophytica]BCJ62312.1 sugar ABC transporter substrate-binding protein [Micromonospora endophytica]